VKKNEGYEKLRARLEESRAEALASMLQDASIEDLEGKIKDHPLGENAAGWKNPYPADDPRNLLLQYQFVSWHDKARFIAELWSRQTGKDFTLEGVATEDCLKTERNEWMIAAPSERQSLDSLDKAKEWAEAFSLKIDDYQERREGSTSQTLLKSAEIVFENKSRIRAVPGKPDTVRGRSTNVGITEFDFLENPAATWRALLPSITNPLRGGQKKVRLITTPNGVGSAMHKIMTKGDGKKMSWSRRIVTIYHAVLMGLPVDIEELREAMDDAEGFAQEFLCQFLDSSNVLLPYDIIQLAESFDATEAWSLADATSAPSTFLGIDFGRTTDPTVCWTLQLVGGILWTREVLVLQTVNSADQEQILIDRIRAAKRVCFDYTGPGIGLGDYLSHPSRGIGEWDPAKHKFGKLELCTFTTALKRELFPTLRRAFEAPTKLRIPVSTVIREDLHEMQQVITNGEYNYWSPRTKNGHSDRCTALALAVRAAGSPGGIISACVPMQPHGRAGGSGMRGLGGML
jgi:phage FluMu gp28-like protein